MLLTLDSVLNEQKYGMEVEDDCFGNEVKALDGDYVASPAEEAEEEADAFK